MGEAIAPPCPSLVTPMDMISNKPRGPSGGGHTSTHGAGCSGAGHFGIRPFRHFATKCKIISGAVSRRNCPGSEVSRLFLDPVPKCRYRYRSVLWPKCPVTGCSSCWMWVGWIVDQFCDPVLGANERIVRAPFVGL